MHPRGPFRRVCRHLTELVSTLQCVHGLILPDTRTAADERGVKRTGMADARVVDLNAHLVRARWSNFDILNREVLAGFPGNRSL
jgi:hypothetical protein